MKRTLIILLAAVMVLFCACGKAETQAQAQAEAKPLTEIFNDIKEQVGFDNVTELTSIRLMERYYGITDEMAAEYAGCVNASGVSLEEVVLVKAVDDTQAAAVKDKLDNCYQAKLNQNKNYNPEQAAMVEKCSVVRDGLYVSMILSENADKITEIYRSEANLG